MTPEKYKQKLEADPHALALAEKIWEAAEEVLGRPVDTGGCTPFYTVEEWRSRGEEYGCRSMLIVCHDGGDLAPLINYDYEAYDLVEDFNDALREIGVWLEPCTCWYAAVYPVKEEEYKKAYVCEYCGSTELCNPNVETYWNMDSQAWEVKSITDSGWLHCKRCDTGTRVIERTTPIPL